MYFKSFVAIALSLVVAHAEEPVGSLQPSPPVVRGFMSNGTLEGNDFVAMRQWGANVVRLQCMVQREAAKLKKPLWDAWPEILNKLEAEVVRAKSAGLKVVVVMMQSPLPGVAPDNKTFWNDNRLSPAFCRIWKDVATRMLPYKDSIWGYDIFNEPLDRAQLPNSPKEWRQLANQITETIRSVDPDVWIICETGPGFFFTGFDGFEPLADKRVIYSGHFYEPDWFTHQGILTKTIGNNYPSVRDEQREWSRNAGAKDVQWNKERLAAEMQPAVDFQKKYNVPIYVGEFSVARWAPKEDAVHWLRDVIALLEERGWSWTYHAFRENNAWSLEHDETYWKDGKPQPVDPVSYETERAKVIKEALSLNSKEQ